MQRLQKDAIGRIAGLPVAVGYAGGGFVRTLAGWGDKFDKMIGGGSTSAHMKEPAPVKPAPEPKRTAQEQAMIDLAKRRQLELAELKGMAGGGRIHPGPGKIAGKYNPKVADDITINAKKGEYIVPAEVVNALGEAYFNNLVLNTKKKLGLPAKIGAKRHSDPDSLGRMDKPGLRGDVLGAADSSLTKRENLFPELTINGNPVVERVPVSEQQSKGLPTTKPPFGNRIAGPSNVDYTGTPNDPNMNMPKAESAGTTANIAAIKDFKKVMSTNQLQTDVGNNSQAVAGNQSVYGSTADRPSLGNQLWSAAHNIAPSMFSNPNSSTIDDENLHPPVPTTPATATPQSASTPNLAAIKVKDQSIVNTRTVVPTTDPKADNKIAERDARFAELGITSGGVSAPGGNTIIGNPLTYQTAQYSNAPLANGKTPVEMLGVQRRVNENGSLGGYRMDKNDWSDGSANQLAYAASANYDEQVARAKQINDNTMRQLAQFSPKEAAEYAIAKNPKASRTARQNAMGEVAQAKNRIANINQQLKDNQAMQIAGMTAQNEKYKADQHLEGQRLIADAHTDANRAADRKARQDAELKASQNEEAARKEQDKQAKEMQKMQRETATKWVRDQTGMQHPDDIKTAIEYLNQKDMYEQAKDTFLNRLPPQSRDFWINGINQGDKAVLDALAKRGIKYPAAVKFPARTPATSGIQLQEG